MLRDWCNGITDCPNAADEEDCPKQRVDEFRRQRLLAATAAEASSTASSSNFASDIDDSSEQRGEFTVEITEEMEEEETKEGGENWKN